MSEESLANMVTEPVTADAVGTTQNSEVETSETENTNSAEPSENDEGTDESQISEDLEAIADKPKKSGFEKRIAKEVARKNAALEELNFWKKEALKSKGTDESQVSTQPSATDKPKFSDYNDLEAYTEAITDWKVEQKLATQAVKSKQDTVVNTYNDRVKEFTKVRPDFQEVLANSDLEISGPVKELIFESDVGPAIALHLAENEELAERIKGMSFVRQVAEIGKLESTLTQKKVDKKVVSKAPAPVSTVKGGAPVTQKSLDDPTLSSEEWIKQRNKQTRFR